MLMNQREVESWHETWMQMAHTIAKRSKDPSTQCGAVIVRDGKHLLGMGFNGPPSAIHDNDLDWNNREEKYMLVFHSESNAIWFAVDAHGIRSLNGTTMYVTGEPCYKCVLEVVRAKIQYMIYDDTKNARLAKMCDKTNWEKVQTIAEISYLKLIPYSKLI